MDGFWAIAISIVVLLALFWRAEKADDPPSTSSARVLAKIAREDSSAAEALDDDAYPLPPAKPQPRWPHYDIKYIDRDGVVTDRRIAVRGHFTRAGVVYVAAYCFLRRDYRHFRANRIDRMVDCSSGDVVADIPAAVKRFRRYRCP